MMKDQDNNQAPPPQERLSHALAGQARRTFWQISLIAVALFASTTRLVLNSEAKSSARRQAAVFASMLEPGPAGDFLESIDRLRQRNPSLLGVGIAGADGALDTLYPPEAALREACIRSIAAPDDTIRSSGYVASAKRDFVVATVALSDGHGPFTLHAAIAVAATDRWGVWAAFTGVALLAWLALILPLHRRNERWHVSNVIDSLASLGRNGQDLRRHQKNMATSSAMRWAETSGIANSLCEIIQELEELRSKDHRSEASAKWERDDKRQKLERKLRRAEDRALTDALTGLGNRAYLEKELEVITTRQRTERKNLAAVMIDIDHFKQYNDSQGHQAGDELLRFLGQLLRGAFRGTDHAIRYGGDEFLVLLPDVDGGQAHAISERVIRLFGQYASRLPGGKVLSLSAGIATLEQDWGQQGADLVERADHALYASKRNGKNGVFDRVPAPVPSCVST